MNTASPLQEISTGVCVISFPLRMLGADFHRKVTLLRLQSGKLIIHSTGPFSAEDITAIQAMGEPAWLVDAMLRHDTFAGEGRAAFPSIPYLAPDGFSQDLGFPVASLSIIPKEWEGEVDVLLVEGVPSYQEYVFFHRASRILLVADLLFNFGANEPFWTELLLRVGMVGGRHAPGMSKPFQKAVEDRPAFEASIARILDWDFDKIIVGHGDVMESDGKQRLREAVKSAGFSVPELSPAASA